MNRKYKTKVILFQFPTIQLWRFKKPDDSIVFDGPSGQRFFPHVALQQLVERCHMICNEIGPIDQFTQHSVLENVIRLCSWYETLDRPNILQVDKMLQKKRQTNHMHDEW